MAEMRKPIVAGTFYPGDKTELEKEVRKYLGKAGKENIKAVIVPHAGYMFSGKLAGKVIGKINKKKDFVLLGVNHSGIGNKLSLSLENFETPLGIVKNNRAFGERILGKLKKEKLDVDVNEIGHEPEHSLEVQLPFLQLSQERFKIIPILLKQLSYEECKKVAEVLSKIIDENIALLVSSDFTHYGRAYGFMPFQDDVRQNLYDLDNKVIMEILNKNSKKVYEKASESTICGLYGLTIITEIARIKKWHPKLVDYYTSGDVVGDYSNCVGYAGLVFS